jgi:hypothetical protein
MFSNAGDTLRRLTFKPLQIVTAPYRKWSDRRQLVHEIREAQHKIVEETNQDLTQFHEVLWSHWPDAVQHVREHIQREEASHEP